MKKRVFWVIALVVAAIAAYYFWKNSESGTSKPDEVVITEQNPEIQGRVIFHTEDGDRAVDVEVARSAYERSKGLMDRTSLPHNQGMLFIFEEMGQRSFWMRNTRIALDIIFVDDKYKIVSIHQNAVPMSEESLLSKGPAQYVIEVNAGYTDLYKIKPGDSLTFDIP